jgi:hypothetical protein
LGSATSIRAETTTVVASSTSEPLPVKRSSRKVSAASGGVCPRAWCPSGWAWLLPSSWPPCSPLERPSHRVEGGASQQDVLGAPQAWRPHLRILPHAAEAPSEQRGEHGWKVRRLEACPGLVQDPPALLLVADAARGRVEGGLTEERSAKLR